LDTQIPRALLGGFFFVFLFESELLLFALTDIPSSYRGIF
jgi:hypothetical protein